MDEVGSAMRHSDHPNCKCVPFIYQNPMSGQTEIYSVFWIIKEERMDVGEVITRDFVAPASKIVLFYLFSNFFRYFRRGSKSIFIRNWTDINKRSATPNPSNQLITRTTNH